jgi:hypothetical protein
MLFSDLVAATDRAVQGALGGEPVIYAPATGAPVTVTGVFDSQFVLAKGDAHAGVETAGPAVFVRSSDLPTNPDLDDPILTIRSVTYRVIERMSDDMGGIILVLRRNV